MKKLLSIVLALALVITAMSAIAEDVFTSTAVNPYDWRDLTQWPVVADGESLEISVLCKRGDSYGLDAEDMWLWNFLPQATGIKMNVEQVSDSAKAEKVKLLLAANSLPDVLWGLALTADQLVLYGEQDGILMDLSPYVTPDVMPNLYKLEEFRPGLIAAVTQSNGGIYSLPYLGPNNPGSGPFMMVNNDLMKEAGFDSVPETLDELTDMLYGIKENHPDVTPLGGSWAAYNPIMYVLNAYGYLTKENGTKVAVRDGKAVIPAADETFKNVLETLNQYYTDGIISRDFFTLDKTGVKAQVVEGEVATIASTLNGIFDSNEYDKYSHWVSLAPLTSDWNDTKQWPAPDLIGIGNVCLSANCPDPETVLRFLDGFYQHEIFVYLHWGPLFGQGDDAGIYGGWAIEDWTVLDLNIDGSEYSSNASGESVSFSNGVIGNGAFSFEHPQNTPKQFKFYVWGYDINHPQYADTDANGYCRLRYNEQLTSYETSGFPSIVYLDVNTASKIQELSSILVPYMEGEIAKFITGQRSLDEFDAYLAELESMGMDEYSEFYADYYANYID